ncbi:MAG: thioesterase family protein [Clostridia bacterium]|nr:thioesterase family protein [Clostridia bacterium]
MLEVGIKGKKIFKVTDENTAEHLLSGMLPVYATPSLIALMEYTCFSSVHPLLDEGLGTVGSSIMCSHISPTPVGGTVTCESELIEVDRRRLVFRVRAEDEFGLIGEGTHERFIIDNHKFMNKVAEKQAALEKLNADGAGKPGSESHPW